MTQSIQKPTILLITLLCAGNGFLVETNITQTIAASLGGTLLQYQLGIGLFIFSLGMGSLLYLRLGSLFDHSKILIFSTLSLISLSILGPALIYTIGETWQLTLANPFAWLAYAPLIVVGLITGLDLPVLIFLGQTTVGSKESHILGFDYLGMFIACMAFPFLFQKLGVFNLIYANLVIGALTLLLLLVLPFTENVSCKESHSHLRKGRLLFLSFMFSFCSLSYELLMARWVVDFFHNEVYAMTYGIGFFLMGMALGSFTVNDKNLGKQLIKIETMLIASALCLPLLGFVLATMWTTYFFTPQSQIVMQFFFLLFIGWIGFLSGHELPILMKSLSTEDQKAWPALFFWNYLGALVASVVVSLYLLPSFGLQISLILVVATNVFLFLVFRGVFSMPRLDLFSGLALIALALAFVPDLTKQWEQIYLKATYNKVKVAKLSLQTFNSFQTLDRELSDIRRIVTPYQNIDLVRTEIPNTGTGYDDLHLYINQQPQFSLFYHDLYHDSFSVGALNLAETKPKKVLILGGGDGLLAHKLSQQKGIQSMTLIELDPAMIDLAKSHWRIKKANGNIFESSRLKVFTEDAFSWLKSHQQVFDAIFVDFPYPTNYELSRLYSQEFYRLVARRLDAKGFLIMNAPISFRFNNNSSDHLRPTATLLNTLKTSGFQTVLPFGSIEPFIYAERQQRALAFNYQSLPETLPNSSFVNLVPIQEVLQLPDSDQVNSVYRPKKVVSW